MTAAALTRGGDAELLPSQGSLRALDWLNFFIAGVQTAVGPFLATFLAGERWDAQRIGLVLTLGTLAGIAVQAPLGWIVDWLHGKRLLVGVAIVAVAGGSLCIAEFPVLLLIIMAQMVIGAALTVFAPTICAISLGLVGRERFPARQGRNQAFIAAGNIIAALGAGLAAYLSTNRAIFILVGVSALPALWMVTKIRAEEIDYHAARQAGPEGQAPFAYRAADDGLRTRALIVFTMGAVLLNLANAALLPLLGERAEQTHKGSSMLFMAACVVTAQTVMMLLSPFIGRMAAVWRRRPLLIVAFALLPVRCLLYTLTTDPRLLVASEILDGICSSIFAVVSVLVIADLARGTGRFNLTFGLIAMAINIGASLSQVTAGFVAHRYGFASAFVYLAVVAAAALLTILVFLPETAVDRPLAQRV